MKRGKTKARKETSKLHRKLIKIASNQKQTGRKIMKRK
jgi:hypothetical protein